ncbi:CHAD domain-containing protein [Methylobacter sp. G7]|uniref:CHAD domain-containing protein n=1 Tax=Methylobacter sp. G7 TaxID=3230117 RepID=UPI003D803982
MSLQFEFPANLTAENFIAALSHEVDTQLASRQSSCKTYYDSFDWRLYSNDITGEFNQAKSASSLTLRSIKNGSVIAESERKTVPLFSKEFEPGIIHDIVAPLLEMRALLPVCTLEYEVYHLNIVNKNEKIIVRLLIEAYSQFNSRVLLQPVKGYDKAAEHIAELLTATLGLTATDKSVLLTALQIQGRKPKDYSSKLNINLDPEMRADIAGKYIYSHLLKAIKVNEQGTIAHTDSEFLHDFRVAVRRTRAGLSQIKGILPPNISAHYADFFCWLGQITGPARDLDVYLLSFDRYKSSLPDSIRKDLNPLYDFLLIKQQKARKELAKKLQSTQYLSTLAEWELYLKEPSYKKPLEENAKLSIKELADRRIWKTFTRVLQEGEAINGSSADEALHDLRKSCKKLRYLMEFFQSLYSEHQIKHLIKNLKGLQEVLGDFQDYAVQEHTLKLFSEEMMALNIPANTFLAMGVLIQDLDAHRYRARKDFASEFEVFQQEENQSDFRILFASSKSRSHQHGV